MKGLEHQWATALACVAVLALPLEAFAAREKRSSISVLRVESQAFSPELVKQLDSATRTQVAESLRGVKLLRVPAIDFDSLRLLASCADDGPACLAAIGGNLGATQVLRVVLEREGRNTTFTFHRVTVRDKKAKTASATIVDFGPESIDEFRAQLAIALGDTRPVVPAKLALEASASDPGALEEIEIYFDDHKIPVNVLSNLPAGEHTIEIHRQGFAPFKRTVTLKAGRTTQVEVAFAPLPEERPREEALAAREAPPAAVPVFNPAPQPTAAVTAPVQADLRQEPRVLYTWFLAGGAVVATGVGVAFWAQQEGIEQRLTESKLSCDSEPKPEDCKKGVRTELGTYIAFPAAGLLGAAAVTAFILEGGLDYFRSDAPREAPAISGSIAPLSDGIAASFTARY